MSYTFSLTKRVLFLPYFWRAPLYLTTPTVEPWQTRVYHHLKLFCHFNDRCVTFMTFLDSPRRFSRTRPSKECHNISEFPLYIHFERSRLTDHMNIVSILLWSRSCNILLFNMKDGTNIIYWYISLISLFFIKNNDFLYNNSICLLKRLKLKTLGKEDNGIYVKS